MTALRRPSPSTCEDHLNRGRKEGKPALGEIRGSGRERLPRPQASRDEKRRDDTKGEIFEAARGWEACGRRCRRTKAGRASTHLSHVEIQKNLKSASRAGRSLPGKGEGSGRERLPSQRRGKSTRRTPKARYSRQREGGRRAGVAEGVKAGVESLTSSSTKKKKAGRRWMMKMNGGEPTVVCADGRPTRSVVGRTAERSVDGSRARATSGALGWTRRARATCGREWTARDVSATFVLKFVLNSNEPAPFLFVQNWRSGPISDRPMKKTRNPSWSGFDRGAVRMDRPNRFSRLRTHCERGAWSETWGKKH